MNIWIAFAISLMLHISVSFIKVDDKKPKPKPKPKQQKQKKSPPVKIKFLSIVKGEEQCPEFYVGIGVIRTWLDMEVTDVAPGGPAYKNDIRVGDFLLTDPNYDSLKPGTIIEVPILRNGITIVKNMAVEKICTSADD